MPNTLSDQRLNKDEFFSSTIENLSCPHETWCFSFPNTITVFNQLLAVIRKLKSFPTVAGHRSHWCGSGILSFSTVASLGVLGQRIISSPPLDYIERLFGIDLWTKYKLPRWIQIKILTPLRTFWQNSSSLAMILFSSNDFVKGFYPDGWRTFLLRRKFYNINEHFIQCVAYALKIRCRQCKFIECIALTY